MMYGKNHSKNKTYLLFSSLVSALGGVGDPCTDACDCEFPLACHGGICSENCYSHSECNDYGCRYGEGYYCGADSICVPALGGVCYESMVCPECECTGEVCFGFQDHFIDNLDNDCIYCTDATVNCWHLGVMYLEHSHAYLSDMQNTYQCLGIYGWGQPVCHEGCIWNPSVPPSDNPNDGCIPITPVSEFPYATMPLAGT